MDSDFYLVEESEDVLVMGLQSWDDFLRMNEWRVGGISEENWLEW